MSADHNLNEYFMIFIFFIGIVLFAISWNIDQKLQSSLCTNTALKTSNKLVLCIGNMLIAFSLSYLGFYFYCNKEGKHQKGEKNENKSIIYAMGTFVFGILLIILGIIINVNSIQECNNYGSSTIWGLGSLLVILSVFFIMRSKKEK